MQRALAKGMAKLKALGKNGPEGLALFCSEDAATIVHPPRPLQRSLYSCGGRFDTGALRAMVVTKDEPVFGLIVIDGNEAVVARFQGSEAPTVLATIRDGERIHGRCRRGGQSALRFERLRNQTEFAYVAKVASVMEAHFLASEPADAPLPHGGRKGRGKSAPAAESKSSSLSTASHARGLLVRGVVIAGKADLKRSLATCQRLDARLRAAVLALVTVSQGGTRGLVEAVRHEELRRVCSKASRSEEVAALAVFEDRLVHSGGIGQDLAIYGTRQTLQALQAGAVETLLLGKAQAADILVRYDGQGNVHGEWDTSGTSGTPGTPATTLAEWAPAACASFRTHLQWVSDASLAGHAFNTGFGGVGGLLRWSFVANDPDSGDEGPSVPSAREARVGEEAWGWRDPINEDEAATAATSVGGDLPFEAGHDTREVAGTRESASSPDLGPERTFKLRACAPAFVPNA